MNRTVPAVALAAVALALTACGSTSTVTVHGTVQPYSTGDSLTDGLGYAQTYSECSIGNPAPGTQVTVTDPTGKVIGSPALGLWQNGSVSASV
jgi:hypothetical protein